MFHLWNLLCFCGLLTGTSAALLPDLGSVLSNTVDKVTSVVQDGLVGTVENTVQDVLEKLKVDLGPLQDSSVFQQVQSKILGAESLLADIISNIQSSDGLLGVKITNSAILDVKVEPAADGLSTNVRTPITTNVSVSLPLVGQVINLSVYLDLLAGLSVTTDPQTGLLSVAVGECATDPASISLSVLDSNIELINKVLQSVSGTVSNIASVLVQQQICPLLRILLSGLQVKSLSDITCESQGKWIDLLWEGGFWGRIPSEQ
ncbi:BPI fold-containing family A member 2 [Fukomys damarensis]|uniref:BPI fold-containing family A member 2 n=1 Tax=Fukomys damarensis TaxID=885580 RepID=UPI00053FE3C5|nr:BPI fold-containing family A member 2 [Fukomys damarensis]